MNTIKRIELCRLNRISYKMLTITVALSILAFASGSVIPLQRNSEREEYIVGGKPTKIEDVPYQIALLSKKMDFVCGGSIVSSTHIITAAHCIDTVYPLYQQYYIRAGSSIKNKGGQVIASKKVVVHSKYNPKTMDYDIATIELSSPLKFTNGSRVIPVAKKEPGDGELVKVSGWGCLKENGTRPNELHSVSVAVVNRRECEKNYKNLYTITNRMICAAARGKDSCQGDSGGPLAYKGTLIGVVSFGNGCARENYPGVYVNVADPEIRKFIKETTNLNYTDSAWL